eukprot:COSAG06_NODE_5282_length_3588_cov_17.136715_3_plen_153_part_00
MMELKMMELRIGQFRVNTSGNNKTTGEVVPPLQGVQSAMYLHMVTDADLPQEFLRSYDQVQIGSSFGGHGLRDWARHSDAAFVGQWALAIQSAKIGCGPEGTPDTWFPCRNATTPATPSSSHTSVRKKKTSFLQCLFNTENRVFAKTGSGPT